MKELSLNILDIAMNSVKAKAKNVGIYIEEKDNFLTLTFVDDGCGMTFEQVEKLRDPFFTTRTTRKVGLGVPFLALAAEQTGGEVTIESRPESEFPESHGTTVKATFDKTSIDFTPLGDVVSTVITLVQGSPDIDFVFSHKKGENEVSLDTKELRSVLGEGVSLSEPEVLAWIKGSLEEEYSSFTD